MSHSPLRGIVRASGAHISTGEHTVTSIRQRSPLRPAGARKLRGEERAWRIRVGPYRVLYDVRDDRALVVVLKVARRSETTHRR